MTCQQKYVLTKVAINDKIYAAWPTIFGLVVWVPRYIFIYHHKCPKKDVTLVCDCFAKTCKKFGC